MPRKRKPAWEPEQADDFSAILGDPVYVESSNVAYFQYDDENSILYTRFLDGSLYAYFDVDEEKAFEAFHADSPGGFVHDELGEHSYNKIE